MSFSGMLEFVQPATKTPLKIGLRVIVTIVLLIPVLLLQLLSTQQIPNLYALMFVKTLIPLTIVGYLLFGIAD